MAADGRLPLDKLSGAGAAVGDALVWTGTRWAPAAISGPSGPPSYVGVVSGTAATGNTISLSPSVTAGDLLLAAVHLPSADTVTTPAGWTLIAEDVTGDGIINTTQRGYLFARTATGSDNVTFTMSGAGRGVGVAMAFASAQIAAQGVDKSVLANDTKAVVNAPSLNATQDGILLCIFASNGQSSLGTSSGMTEQADVSDGVYIVVSMDTESVTVGPTGLRTASKGSANDRTIGRSVLLVGT